MGSFLLGQHSAHPPKSTEKFVEKTNKDLGRIEKCLSQICQESLRSESMWRNDDLTRNNQQIPGFRGLSQRSLVIEFADWKRKTHGTSILKERATNPLVEPSRKLGHITEFLKTRGFLNPGVARAGIEHGLKLLVSETLLGGIGYLVLNFEAI